MTEPGQVYGKSSAPLYFLPIQPSQEVSGRGEVCTVIVSNGREIDNKSAFMQPGLRSPVMSGNMQLLHIF